MGNPARNGRQGLPTLILLCLYSPLPKLSFCPQLCLPLGNPRGYSEEDGETSAAAEARPCSLPAHRLSPPKALCSPRASPCAVSGARG